MTPAYIAWQPKVLQRTMTAEELNEWFESSHFGKKMGSESRKLPEQAEKKPEEKPYSPWLPIESSTELLNLQGQGLQIPD